MVKSKGKKKRSKSSNKTRKMKNAGSVNQSDIISKIKQNNENFLTEFNQLFKKYYNNDFYESLHSDSNKSNKKSSSTWGSVTSNSSRKTKKSGWNPIEERESNNENASPISSSF